MAQRHRHADLIHAWAEGAEIQRKFEVDGWLTVPNGHLWEESAEYRIKPEKKPDVVKSIGIATTDAATCGLYLHFAEDNLRLTFSGDTGKLIKAEVL